MLYCTVCCRAERIFVRLPVTVVHRHGCLKSVLHWNPECFVPQGGHSHVRGLCVVVPDHRSSLRTACPKDQWLLHPKVSKCQLQFQLNLAPASAPSRSPTTLCNGPSSHLRLPWYRRHAPGNLSYHSTALHLRRRACHPPGRSFLSHLTYDEGPRRGGAPGDSRAHRTPLCHRYHCSRETLRFGSCDWDKEILVAS